jgi:hypothetical protein
MFPRFKIFFNTNQPGAPYSDNPRKSAGKGSKKSLANGGRMARRNHKNLGSSCWNPTQCQFGGWGCYPCSECTSSGCCNGTGCIFSGGSCNCPPS